MVGNSLMYNILHPHQLSLIPPTSLGEFSASAAAGLFTVNKSNKQAKKNTEKRSTCFFFARASSALCEFTSPLMIQGPGAANDRYRLVCLR